MHNSWEGLRNAFQAGIREGNFGKALPLLEKEIARTALRKPKPTGTNVFSIKSLRAGHATVLSFAVFNTLANGRVTSFKCNLRQTSVSRRGESNALAVRSIERNSGKAKTLFTLVGNLSTQLRFPRENRKRRKAIVFVFSSLGAIRLVSVERP